METPQIHEHAYYYDSHSTEEDNMGETGLHSRLIRYLMEVLAQLFWGQHCAIHENLNFYFTLDRKKTPIAPDIAVVKGVDFEPVTSWELGITGPAPQVVFEIASEETWRKDLALKPLKYAQMGVEEYFAYDPNEPLLKGRKGARRLYGWQQLDPEQGTMLELPRGFDGRLWSEQLQSWLVPDGGYLRLHDVQGNLRLTRAEALAEKLRSLGIDPDQP